MEITKEESRAYVVGIQFPTPSMLGDMVRALRRHVAAEMRLEFGATNHIYMPVRTESGGVQVKRILTDPGDARHNFTDADWDRAAHEALMGGS